MSAEQEESAIGDVISKALEIIRGLHQSDLRDRVFAEVRHLMRGDDQEIRQAFKARILSVLGPQPGAGDRVTAVTQRKLDEWVERWNDRARDFRIDHPDSRARYIVSILADLGIEVRT